jgi:hypothetical protein
MVLLAGATRLVRGPFLYEEMDTQLSNLPSGTVFNAQLMRIIKAKL